MRNFIDGRVSASDVYAWRVYDGRAARGAYRVALFMRVPDFVVSSIEAPAVMDDFGSLVLVGAMS